MLFRVVYGTWRSECRYYEYAIHGLTWHILVRSDLYIGPPECPGPVLDPGLRRVAIMKSWCTPTPHARLPLPLTCGYGFADPS